MLRFACSFLGNDFLERASGNGPTKVRDFIDGITEDENGKLKSYTDSYNFILNSVLIPKTKTKSSHVWLCVEDRKKSI